MDNFGSGAAFEDLTVFGPVSQRVAQRSPNTDVARSMIANNFWRAFIESNSFPRALGQLNASVHAYHSARTIVVPRQDLMRFDLLVLDVGLKQSTTPRLFEVGPQAFGRSDIINGATRASRSGTPAIIGPESIELALETALNTPTAFNVVLAPQPFAEYLGISNKLLEVEDSGRSLSTAGMVVRCMSNSGAVGVTAALHAVSGSATGVTVNSLPGTVCRSDRLFDAAFIELASAPTLNFQKTHGPMKGILPRGRQTGSFWGAGTNCTNSTVITGWDAGLPVPGPYRQALVYTTRDAVQGDSGAALVTDDDWVVGFAFERSLPFQEPAYCSWVWADSVLQALVVEPF